MLLACSTLTRATLASRSLNLVREKRGRREERGMDEPGGLLAV